MPRKRLKEESKYKWREEWRPEEIEWISRNNKDWISDEYSEEPYKEEEEDEEEYEDEEEWDWEDDEDEDEE